MKQINIKIQLDDEGVPNIRYNDITYSTQDFIEKINEVFNLEIEHTWDDGYYDCIAYGRNHGQYQHTIDELEDEFGRLDWEDVEGLYFAHIQESINWFKEKFEELECIDIIVEVEDVSEVDKDEVFGALKEKLQKEKYWNKFEELKEDFSERLEKLGYDFNEFYGLLKNNFDTNGKASRNLLEEDGYIESWMSEDFDLDELEEGEEYYSWYWEKIESIIHAMNVARRRHEETDYDSISKSKMSDDEVTDLRKFYNNK